MASDKGRKTYGEQFESALKCETPEQAQAWLAAEVEQHCAQAKGCSAESARSIILQDLGYMAGYYNDAAAQKIHALFGAVHPVFGRADYHKTGAAR